MQPKVQAKKTQAHFHFFQILLCFFSYSFSLCYLCLFSWFFEFETEFLLFQIRHISLISVICLKKFKDMPKWKKEICIFTVMSFLSRHCSSYIFFFFCSYFANSSSLVLSHSNRQKNSVFFFSSLVTSFACTIVWRKLYNNIYIFKARARAISSIQYTYRNLCIRITKQTKKEEATSISHW